VRKNEKVNDDTIVISISSAPDNNDAGCAERIDSDVCCFSPMAAVPFLLLVVFQMRND
jgi:hypothetical protein